MNIIYITLLAVFAVSFLVLWIAYLYETFGK